LKQIAPNLADLCNEEKKKSINIIAICTQQKMKDIPSSAATKP